MSANGIQWLKFSIIKISVWSVQQIEGWDLHADLRKNVNCQLNLTFGFLQYMHGAIGT